MGKLMINGEQYPAIVVKAGLDDTQTRKDATWSSDKINEELEDVRSELDIIVEEANKNTTISDGTTSLTTTWSSKKTSDEIAKHSLPITFDSGIINNSTVQVYKLANVGYTASGGTDAYNLNLLLSSRGAEEIELIGGKNDGGWIIEAIRNNKSFNKITNIYQDGLDIYVRLDLRCNYFRVYHKSGVLSDNFAVSLVDTVPESATELTVTEYATKDDLSAKQDSLSARKVYVRRNSSANKYVLLATIDMRVLTNLGQPLRIKGVIGNMANDITNIDLTINARNGFVKKILYGTVTHKNFLTNDVNIIITKSDDGKTAYVYLDCISIYGYIDAEIYLGSVHYSVPSTFDLVGTIQGTEYTSLLDSNYVVIENVINDTSTGDTASTWSSSKIASAINPTIDGSKVFSDGTLNINTLCSTYGNGRYVIVGQGTAGNGSATIDIWTLVGNAISYIVNVTYSNRTSNMFIGYTYDNPTINFETGYFNTCNHIAKVCTLA